MDNLQAYSLGETVYIIIRNPHAQAVANIQQATVMQNPDRSDQLALFCHETHFPLTDQLAVFKSELEAEQALHEAFGAPAEGEYYG